MTSDESLTRSKKVQRLQRVLHAKAKAEPERRFHALADKVWRMDFLHEAWRQVRRNGGQAGVDGETIAMVEAQGVEAWLRELSHELQQDTYRPRAVRQVLIPKKQPGKFRPLGIPCVRDRVAQTSAMLILSPIFEADLQPEQYAYRPNRGANEAVIQIHQLVSSGHREVVDGDLSNYFGEIPHAELMRSIARRVSDGRMLALIKAWLTMAVVEEDGKGGKRRTNRARKECKGTPQGSPISPLFSNIYMRRFIVGWKHFGFDQLYGAQIVNYADDFCVLGKAPAAEMLRAVKDIMTRLKLPLNEQKTRCLRCPDEVLEFLGYCIGWNYRHTDGSRYIGTRPSAGSVKQVRRRISELTQRRYLLLDADLMVARLNRVLLGWSNYFHCGQVSPAYRRIDHHARRRLRQWLCRKHRVKSGGYVRFSDDRLYREYGLVRLVVRTKRLPWAKA